MSVKDIHPDDLPTSDLPEIVHRLGEVKNGLDEVNDDYSRQEIYDRISMSATIISNVMGDLMAIGRVLMGVVNA